MPPPTDPSLVKYSGDSDLPSVLQGCASLIDSDEKWGHQLCLPTGLGNRAKGCTLAALEASGGRRPI